MMLSSNGKTYIMAKHNCLHMVQYHTMFYTMWTHHSDVMTWRCFLHYWPFVRGIHQSPVNSPHKGQWCEALMFSLTCAWINVWVKNGLAGDLRRHHAHCDVTVMLMITPWLRNFSGKTSCGGPWVYCRIWHDVMLKSLTSNCATSYVIFNIVCDIHGGIDDHVTIWK